jgi:NTP pyrophosphatase (non-canonical NTP hydrolase)
MRELVVALVNWIELCIIFYILQVLTLVLGQVGEVGELSELFMWKGEVQKGCPGWEESEKEHLGEELSDVLLYLIRLSDMCGVDLGDAALKKIVKNAVKYPAPSKGA